MAGVNQVVNTNNTGTLLITKALPRDGDSLTVNGTTQGRGDQRSPRRHDHGAGGGLQDRIGHRPLVEALVISAGLGDDTINVSGSGGPPA